MTDFGIPHESLTLHAWQRMGQRAFSFEAVCRIMDFGRVLYIRGAMIFAIGHKEVEIFKKDGIDLSELEGGHVICSPSGKILTVYRNKSFQKLRDWSRKMHKRPSKNSVTPCIA